MALTCSVDQVDENGRELLTYGTAAFPIAFFDDDLTKVAVPTHWHDELEIVVMTKGIVRVRIAGSDLVLTAGEGYFANRGILHAATLESKAGHQHALVFSPKIVSQAEDLIWQSCIAPVLGNPRLPFIRLTPSVPWQKELLRLAETAWDFGAYDKADYPIQVRSCLTRAFSLITANLDGIENELRYTGKYQRDELRVKKALLFIERNYDSAVLIDDIAASAGIGVSTCLRLFRTVLGTTPVRYLIQHRLERAAEELRRPNNRTIAQIAYACGFSDASYFNRCFRKEYGMTPSEYSSTFTPQMEPVIISACGFQAGANTRNSP